MEDVHQQELRRGTVVLGCLLILQTPEYGYQLLESLNGSGMDVDGNTLYPLLRRLEKQGLLSSDWNTDEPRPRKYYTTTEEGRATAQRLLTEWQRLNRTLAALAKGHS